MEIFHVLSRGVDKRELFTDDKDRFRFVHDLFEFNDQDRVANNFYAFRKNNDIASRYIKPRKLLGDILAFCLMPNHYHLLLAPKIDNGISRFMKKLNMGYVKYFNEKHRRKGTLFEGRYKSVAVENEAHFIHLPYYIHLNPLDLVAPEWRERKVNNYETVIKFLDSYRWSSHLDYTGKKNFPSVIKRDYLYDYFGGMENYKKSINDWLKDLRLEDIYSVSLE